ncbi:MAG: cell division protein [Paucimonas sp.]|nr:cell division protein [Paucimonas sp.]
MNELQASLIAIGSTIVVGVLSYNKWQEYKARKSVDRAFSSAPDDVLMGEGQAGSRERREPMLDAGPAPVADGMGQPQSQTGGAGSEHEMVVESATLVEGLARAPQRPLPVDELIDCEIAIELDGPVRGEKVLPAIQGLRQIGGKPVHYIGQAEDGQWEEVAISGIYTTIRAGVQMANRMGALNEIEFSEVVTRLRQVADEIGGEPFAPDMTQVISMARHLHQFVAEHDAQLGINVHTRGAPWAISTLLAALERQGFDVRPDGRLVMQDGDSGVLFSLSTNVGLAEEATTRLTLLLDVPRVARERDGFGAMVACARMLASRLDGIVVDDAGQPLTDEALAEIASQVDSFYTDMASAEIAAGSPRALRLFS